MPIDRKLTLCGVALLLTGATGRAMDTRDTRMLADPAVSDTHVAFVYAEDLWVCQRDGSDVRRLTTHQGVEVRPRFSPDGRTLAFTAQYDGNPDVYTVPVTGGVPRRLTWHPGSDLVQDFHPDGQSILFTSPRSVFTNRHTQLFEASVTGGYPQQLPIPHAFKASYSPDAGKIAYVPLYEAFRQWKNYRGGTASRIWLYDRADHSVVQIPQPEGRCNDTDPMWIGDRVFFLSDRSGEFNLFSYDVAAQQVAQHTRHEDFPILRATDGPGVIAYEQGGWIHLFDVARGSGARLKIGVAADLIETRPRYVTGDSWIRGGDLSPSGARAVLEYRGDIITVPAKKGDPRNLTGSPGVHERSPAWSADGQWIAWFSDESGEYELHVARQDGSGGLRKFQVDGAGFYEDPRWSPDGKYLSFSDNSWSLYLLELETGDLKKVSSEPLYGPLKTLSHGWSPDSRWLTYTRITPTYFQRVWVYDVKSGQSTALTDGLSDVSSPVFDKSGKYLYFMASTDAGPVRQWFAMSNADMEMTQSLYVAVLEADEPSPLAPESDEEPVKEEPPEGEAEGESGAQQESSAEGEGEVAAEEGEPGESPGIDFEGFEQRILALPVPTGYYTQLQAGADGLLYYLRSPSGGGLFVAPQGDTGLYRYDLGQRKEEQLGSGIGAFRVSADGSKLLVAAAGGWSIVPAGPGINPASSRLPTGRIKVKIDPRAEWKQIYREVWRINRDYFYAPNMHGADWPAMLDKYEVFLPHLAVRSDLNRLIQWLCSELAVGHHNVFGGDRLFSTTSVPVGLLGADYEVDSDRYRFAKVFGGLNWSPELHSPLTAPGVNVKAGEYLLAVDGEDLKAPDNLYARFENKVGSTVELTVGPAADGSDQRTVKAVPIGNESALRNRDWVEGNLRKVEEATHGRVAYVYVPNTTALGHTYFKRYFFPQADREAIIVDERFNGGGQVADYYIDILRRPEMCWWATRYGADLKTPLSSIQGPKVMLIDETAGSGGDLLPWMFHKLGIGPLIGRATWGGLVGMLGFPPLLDGGMVTAPNLAIWTEDGFVVENVGVPPDIEVEQLPAAVIAGHDPQLEKAIEVILEQLGPAPAEKPKRPPYPIRARR